MADMYCDERGTGDVVYLVHAGVFSSWFAPLFSEPALDGFRVIRPVREGYGGIAPPNQPKSLAAHARSCAALLRERGAERVHWVGHSSSCCIGLQMALDAPDLVASLILFEPAKPSGAVRAAHAATYVAPSLEAAAKGDVATAFDIFMRGVGGDGYRKPLTECLGDDGVVEAERESAYFFADELPAVGLWSFGSAEAERISVPVLLISGSETRPWFPDNIEVLAAMLPNARRATVPGTDHLLPLTHPHLLAAVIAEHVTATTDGNAAAALDPGLT
jgi:pimeloyl-ACP methyl ester carboxylesterase